MGSPDDPTRTRVERWLGDKGVRLEIEVAAAFSRRLGRHSVEHARYYLSEEDASGERKIREVDVVAQCRGTYQFSQFSQFSDAAVNTWFIVECKSSKNDPWVLYRSESTTKFMQQDALGLVRRALRVHEDGVTIEQLDRGKVMEAVGSLSARGDYAYHVADLGESASKSNSKRAAFSAVQQVLSAVDGALSGVAGEPSQRLLSVFVPVVVTGAPLFTVDLGGAGYEVNTATYVPLIARLRPTSELSLVWLVQADHLNDYLEVAISGAQALRVTST